MIQYEAIFPSYRKLGLQTLILGSHCNEKKHRKVKLCNSMPVFCFSYNMGLATYASCCNISNIYENIPRVVFFYVMSRCLFFFFITIEFFIIFLSANFCIVIDDCIYLHYCIISERNLLCFCP